MGVESTLEGSIFSPAIAPDELRSFPSGVAKKYVDAELANTQALERAGSQRSEPDEDPGDRSDRSRQPVRSVGRRELREDL